MKKISTLLLALALLLTLSACAAAFNVEDSAKNAMDRLAKRDYAAVESMLSSDARAILNADAIGTGWTSIINEVGEFISIESLESAETGGNVVTTVNSLHENGSTVTTIVFNKSGDISGLNIKYDMAEAPPEGAVAQTVALRSGQEDETKATLILPEGDGPFPAVVLVHGSGPSNRDEEIMGNRPFRDLAYGLAKLGVASLRYDKYTYAHSGLLAQNPEKSASLTIQEEYINDVTEAVACLKADARISGVYLVGHSQGGMLVPRLLKACGEDAAGGVIMAGSPYHLWQIQYDQNMAVLDTLDGTQKEQAGAQIEAEAQKAMRLNEMTDDELKSSTVFGLPAYYQKDEISVDALQTARELKLPLFIIQGGKDFQINPDKDFTAWQKGLSDADFASFKLYPNANHLFINMEGEPKRSTEDYSPAGQVAPEVISDIASWIKER